MRRFGVLAAAFSMAMFTGPALADSPEVTAWSMIQKINEMAVEARGNCDSGGCPEASRISGMSFEILRHAKRCASGRYPSSCAQLQQTHDEIDGLYAVYLAEAGPERVAQNQSLVREMACKHVPMTGTCGAQDGVIQAQMTQEQN